MVHELLKSADIGDLLKDVYYMKLQSLFKSASEKLLKDNQELVITV